MNPNPIEQWVDVETTNEDGGTYPQKYLVDGSFEIAYNGVTKDYWVCILEEDLGTGEDIIPHLFIYDPADDTLTPIYDEDEKAYVVDEIGKTYVLEEAPV
jgi:hypothetical protein